MKKAQVQKATENVWVLTTADKQVPYFIKYSVQLRTLILQWFLEEKRIILIFKNVSTS